MGDCAHNLHNIPRHCVRHLLVFPQIDSQDLQEGRQASWPKGLGRFEIDAIARQLVQGKSSARC